MIRQDRPLLTLSVLLRLSLYYIVLSWMFATRINYWSHLVVHVANMRRMVNLVESQTVKLSRLKLKHNVLKRSLCDIRHLE